MSGITSTEIPKMKTTQTSDWEVAAGISASVEEIEIDELNIDENINDIDIDALQDLINYVQQKCVNQRDAVSFDKLKETDEFKYLLAECGLEGIEFDNYSDFKKIETINENLINANNELLKATATREAISYLDESINELEKLEGLNLTYTYNESKEGLQSELQNLDLGYISYEFLENYIIENELENQTLSTVIANLKVKYESEINNRNASVTYYENQVEMFEKIREYELCSLNDDFDSVINNLEEPLPNLESILNKLHEYDNIVNEYGGLQYAIEAGEIDINILNEIRNNDEEIKEYLSTNAATNDRYTEYILEWYQISECLTDDEIRIYNYLYEKEGTNYANEYIASLSDQINQRRGLIDATEWINNRNDESEILAFINTFFSGQDSGVSQNLIGIQNAINADGTLTAEQYKMQYIAEFLQENYPKLFSTVYNAGTSLGNMLPMIVLNLTGLGLASNLAASVEMFSSTLGNTYNETIMNGYDSKTAIKYAHQVAFIETVGDMILGTLPGVAVTDLANKLGIDNIVAKKIFDILQEAGSENLQNILEGISKENYLGEKYSITLDEIKETTLVSFILSVIMGGASNTFDILVNNQKYTMTQNELLEIMEKYGNTPEKIKEGLKAAINESTSSEAESIITEEQVQEMLNIELELKSKYEMSDTEIKNEVAEIAKNSTMSKLEATNYLLITHELVDTTINSTPEVVSKIYELTSKYCPETEELNDWLIDFREKSQNAWKDSKGKTAWPPNAGNFPGSKIENVTIKAATRFDRASDKDFSATGGRFVATSNGMSLIELINGFLSGELKNKRAMDPNGDTGCIIQYETIKDINNETIQQAFINADPDIQKKCVSYMLMNLTADDINNRFSQDFLKQIFRESEVNNLDELFKSIETTQKKMKSQEEYSGLSDYQLRKQIIDNIVEISFMNFTIQQETFDFSVSYGIAAPWFDEVGGAEQYEFVISCDLLEKLGFLSVVEKSF